ncbi:magnesium transporter [Roseinatronobacter sp.]|uniref:magnesium transporter n=1 Tax=Roseinatronobacter sp. TaxID=1945755 RepID=UPI0025CB883C|nr:magnesium transporter [Rhodobaca sp.]
MATTTIDTTRTTGAPNRPARDPISERIRDAFVYVTEGAKVTEAIDAVRRSRVPTGQAACVFVIDGKGRYKGFARLSALLRADGESNVNAFIDGADLAAPHDMEQEAAARRLQLRDVPLLPVVNAKSEMIGVLTFDDAMDILEQETTDDIMFKAGVGDVFNTDDHIRSERLTQGPIWYTVRVRILFLMVTLAGGLIVGGLIDQFEDVLGAVIALAIFIPLVMDMGGNVGTQSSTIFARGFALGHVTMQDFWRKSFAREAAVGLVMAVGIALVAGTVAYFWQGVPNDIPQLGVVVGVALFISVLTAACLGFLMPYVMMKMGIDHAPGADPFITTIKDFTGLLVYFLMASWLIGVDLDSDDTAMLQQTPPTLVGLVTEGAE